MFKLMSLAMAASLVAVPAVAGAAIGPDAASCRNGGPAVLVNVTGLKNKTGKVRVQLYGSNPADFLAKGKKLRRVEVSAAAAASAPVCIAVPNAGRYAVAVRHDANGDGKSGWSDGGGFSRNPDISLTNLKPSYSKVAITVGDSVKPIDVVMNYRRGLAIEPIKG